MPDPLVTIAVPTCNGSRHLAGALASFGSAGVPFDLLVVDDRSDDGTADLARDCMGSAGRVVVNPERLGRARNWNRCVALSRTPLVAIFHQDGVMRPGHLVAHVAAFERNPHLGWIASAADVIDDAGRVVPESVVERGGLGPVDLDLAPGEAVRHLMVANPLRGSGVTISREGHARVGGFDPRFRSVVDWDYCWRVALARPVAWRAAPTVAIRWHLGSETRRCAIGTADLDEAADCLARNANRLSALATVPAPRPITVSPAWRREADHRLARAYLNRAYIAARAGRPGLTRRALARAARLDPASTLVHLATDPRLLARLALAVCRRDPDRF